MDDHDAVLSSVTGAASCDGAAATVYLLHQRFRYDYDTPVHHLCHRLIVVPRAVHGDQRRLDHRVTVTGAPALVSVGLDGFANHVVDIRATRVDEAIEFEAWALVRRGTTAPGRVGGPPSAGVTTLSLAAVGDRRLRAATDLTRADGFLADAAGALVAACSQSGPPGAMELAEEICAWSHRALTYAHGVTGVRTSAAEAVAGGRGVCQDYAHVMIAVCRAAGLPARYVSGHLVGEGGSHAWVEVVVADANRPGRAEPCPSIPPTIGGRARATSPWPWGATTPTWRPRRAPSKAVGRACSPATSGSVCKSATALAAPTEGHPYADGPASCETLATDCTSC